eukprot:gnl/TRDRNA2_/TRDRNA2_79187_c0_seq1.p1 gnl/TRDRNA2_/TRDRNA2_79187_c0~~gnl/TRDRNA2_/TRDRNA2_79187_c0_seq1.p1  ORF type:complete len:159 (+),score=4.33 gnl/TRDRNA2_/TRDRNA2_79187_c0_seq1:541-1017(+)
MPRVFAFVLECCPCNIPIATFVLGHCLCAGLLPSLVLFCALGYSLCIEILPEPSTVVLLILLLVLPFIMLHILSLSFFSLPLSSLIFNTCLFPIELNAAVNEHSHRFWVYLHATLLQERHFVNSSMVADQIIENSMRITLDMECHHVPRSIAPSMVVD